MTSNAATAGAGESSESMFSFLRGNVLVMTVTRIFGMFSRNTFSPYFSLYVLALDGNPQIIGFINSIRSLASIFIFPLAGYFADRAGRVKLIVIAGYLSASIYLLYVFAGNWIVLAIANFLGGMIVFQFPAESALMADSLDPKKRGVGFATASAIPGALAVTAPYLAGYLIDRMGVEITLRYLYAAHLCILAFTTTIHWKFLQDSVIRPGVDLEQTTVLEVIKEAYRSVIDVFKWAPRSLKVLALVMGLSFTANAIAGSFWVVYATQVIGLSTTQWGLIVLLYSAVRISVTIPAGFAIDRVGKRKTIMFSFVLSLIPLLYFPFSSGFKAVLSVLLTIAVANACLPPACSALMADVVPREMRGKVMAAFGRGTIMINPSHGGGGGPGMGYAFALPVAFGSLLGGFIYDINAIFPWLLQAIITFGGLVLSLAFIHEPTTAEV